MGPTALVPSLACGANTAHQNPLTHALSAYATTLLAAGGTTPAAALGRANTVIPRLIGLATLAGDPLVTAADPAATSGEGWHEQTRDGARSRLGVVRDGVERRVFCRDEMAPPALKALLDAALAAKAHVRFALTP